MFESPDTQVAVYQFDDLVMIFELTLYTPYMIKSDPELRDSDMYPYWPQNAERIEIYGSQGLMIVGRHGCGWQVFDRPKDRKPVIAAASKTAPFRTMSTSRISSQSIRSRKRPNADIEEGHRSTLMCQLANISYRLGGRKLVVDPETETLVDDAKPTGCSSANIARRGSFRKASSACGSHQIRASLHLSACICSMVVRGRFARMGQNCVVRRLAWHRAAHDRRAARRSHGGRDQPIRAAGA